MLSASGDAAAGIASMAAESRELMTAGLIASVMEARTAN